MPIARFQMPDGRIARYEVPEGLSPEEAENLIQQEIGLQKQELEAHQKKTGFVPALKAGARGFLGGAEEALGFDKAAAEQFQKAAQTFEGTTPEDIARAKEQGVLSTIGAYKSKYITEPLGGIVGRFGAPMAAAAVLPESLIGTGVAAGLARAGTMFATDLPAEVGENIQRQKELGKEVDRGAATLAGLAQAAIASVGIPGSGAITKLLGPRLLAEAEALAPRVRAGVITQEQAVQQLSSKGLEFARATAANAVTGTGLMIGTEELRRAQAGQEMMTPEELKETAIQGVAIAPIFGALHGFGARGKAEAYLTEAQKVREEQVKNILDTRYKLASTDEKVRLQKMMEDEQFKEQLRTKIHKEVDRPVQEIIDEVVGVKAEPTEKETEKAQRDVKAALNEPSGQYVIDPETQIERQLTVGELQKIQRPDLFTGEEANIVEPTIVTDKTLTDLGIGASTPLVKKGGLRGLDLNNPEEAQQFIEGITAFGSQAKLDQKIKDAINIKVKEVQDKQKEAEDARLRTAGDTSGVQISGRPGQESVAGEPTTADRFRADELTTDTRPTEMGTQGRGTPLAPETTEVIKTADELAKDYKGPTLLAQLKRLGGVSLADKLDVTGERARPAPGGYNTIFTSKTEKGLMNHIESGSLDEFLPYDIRLQGGMHEARGEAYDPRPAYDYLADRISNGEKILPFELEQNMRQAKEVQRGMAQEEQRAARTEEDINKDLAEAASVEKDIMYAKYEPLKPDWINSDVWNKYDYAQEMRKRAESGKDFDIGNSYQANRALEKAVKQAYPEKDVRDVLARVKDEYDAKVMPIKEARGEIPLTKETPETIIKVLKDRFGNNVQKAIDRKDLKLVKDIDVPANVAKDAVAYFEKGVAHLIVDRLSKEEAPRKLLHEVGVHYGLEGMLGKALYKDILRTINRLKETDKDVKSAFDHVSKRYKDLKPDAFTEEVLARLGESAPENSLWRRAVAAIKEFLFKKGLWNPNRMDVRDILDLVNRSTQKSLAGKVKPTELGTKAAREVQTNLPPFKRWFGNSKVKDETGAPRVMYHGTAGDAFDIFNKDKIRADDYDVPFNGFWFSSDKFTSPAMRDAKNVIPVYLSIKNPAPSSIWRKVSRQVYNEVNGSNYEKALRPGARSINDEVRYRLQDMGYDGIKYSGTPKINERELNSTGKTTFESESGASYTLVKTKEGYIELHNGKNADDFITDYANLNDFLKSEKEETWVAFEPNQIKSATDNRGTFDVNRPEIQYAKAEERTAPISEQYKATEVFASPIEEADRSFKEHVGGILDRAKNIDRGTMDRAFTGARIKVANPAAGVQTELIRKYNGAVLDAMGNMRADIAHDQALNSNILGATSAKEGKVVLSKAEGAKVVKDPNNVYAIFNELENLSKRIGPVDAEHVGGAYLQALRYSEMLKANDNIDAKIDNLKENLKKDKKEAYAKGTPKDINAYKELENKTARLIVELKDKKKEVSDAQKAAIPAALEYANQFPEIKRIAEIYDKVRLDEIDMLEQAGVYGKDFAQQLRETKGYVPLYRLMDDLEAMPGNEGARQYFRGLADIGKEYAFEGSERRALNIFDNMLTRHMWAVNAATRNFANRMIADELAIRKEDGSLKTYNILPEGKADVMTPIWVDGKRTYVEYADPFFARAIYGVEPALPGILGWFGKASKILRTGVTALPTFQVYQVFNDATRAAMISGVNHPFKLIGEVVYSFGKILKDQENDPIVKEMNRLGISGGYGHTAKEIADKIRRDQGMLATSLTQKAFDKAEKFAATSDMAQRRALFRRSLLETGGIEQADGSIIGGNKVLAMDRAMNIIHWQKHGTSNTVRVMSQIVPFMNAYIQGMDILIRSMKGEGISGRERKEAQWLFVSTALKLSALSAIYSMAVSGDEEYQKLDDRTKVRSLIIPGTGFKIPVSNEVAMLTKAIPELGWQYVTRADTNNPMDATKLANELGRAFVDGLGSPNLMPQGVRGIVEVATNHNFLTGNPIVGRGLENLKTSEQFTENTSELAKLFGQTGIISPLNLDHLLKGYGGTMAAGTLYTTDAFANLFFDNKLPTTPLHRVPLVGSFMYSPNGKDQLNDYYDLKDRSDEVTATLNKYMKFGTREQVKEFAEENRAMINIRAQINQIGTMMKTLREQRKRVIISNLSSDEKRAKLDEIDLRITKQVETIGALRVKAGL
jgi:hypothetical protein